MKSTKWRMTLLLAFGIVSLGMEGTVQGEARVENVRAAQRSGTRMVDVWYDLISPVGGVFDVSLTIGGGGDEPALSTVGGDIGANVIPGRNKKIEWDAGADWAQHVQSNFIATVTAKRSDADTGLSAGMIRIPGGTNSGRDPARGWTGTSAQEYSLTVESFYMDKTEVTYAHWKRIYDWAVAHGYSFANVGSGKGENHPVHTVNWYDCLKWCNARSEMEGRTPAYRVGGAIYRTGQSSPSVDLEGNGYRLPTDTEWQYAARGGLHGYRFPWGNTISHAKANYWAASSSFSYDKSQSYHPRYKDDTKPYTAPVASFAANHYGLFDMVGNVCEWTTSEWNSNNKILGGGGWSYNADECWCARVLLSGPSTASNDTGFRAVRRR